MRYRPWFLGSRVLEGISKIGYALTSAIMSRNPSIQKLRHDVKNYVMTSRVQIWSQLHHNIKTHDAKKFVMTSITCHDVKNTLWRQKVRHDVQNTSWRQKIRHDIQKFVMTSKIVKIRHDVNNIIMTSTNMLRHKMYVLTSKPWPLTYFSDISDTHIHTNTQTYIQTPTLQ